MNDSDSRNTGVDTKGYARRSAGSAAIAALLMCAYGYGALAAPEPDSLFGWCNWFFYYTLRIGGVAFAGVAVWCWMGHVAALAGHGVLSLLVGVSFMLTGVGMLVDGGAMINSVIITVVGWSFVAAGLRDLRAVRYLGAHNDPTGQSDPRRSERPPTRNVAPEPSTEPTLADTLAGPLKARAAERESDRPGALGSSTAMTPDNPSAIPPDSASQDPVSESGQQAEPEGGFLADLARKGRPPGV